MRRSEYYGTTKYHGYIIQGRGAYFELYHPNGKIGDFESCKAAKGYVDREERIAAEKWNDAVMMEYYECGGF